MNNTLTHELIHTLDYCRAEIDWNNLDHLACTEIRAANLSGECFFSKELFTRLKFGWKKHQQVRGLRERERERILYILVFSFDAVGVCTRTSNQVCSLY